ncbi:hypothetical protein SeLEV6574_g03979 [Synchytrium endobioticum]|uniref:Uncharacterized protein n=1 Tax=Synchytrium endobioticum TaxID=286115 RepID=A0A507D1R0_9FUNG|nr:hypothetical protein SeLEV6574_g06187 [Synchytrium endobioticum]TPX45231.1 hypothetical protein SeLEV6574_g03979 [Synchytrium endobioticum]
MAGMILVSQGNSAMCTVISVFGVFFLLLGTLYNNNDPILTGGHEAPQDPKALAGACFGAAAIYAVLFFFCYCQAYLAQRQARAERVYGGI